MHVVLAGGGTAGHVEPALALADALRRADPAVGITALGTSRGLEARLVPERGYDLALIPPVPVPRRPSPELLRLPLRVVSAVRETSAVLSRVGADVVVGFGGYVSAPAYLAGRRHGVPLVVHEANVRPGLANRLGARLTPHVASAWPASPLHGATYVGMPLRRSVSTLDRAARRAEARAHFGLDPDLPCLLVFGGSQGARTLNEAASGASAALGAAGVQVLHGVGRGKSVEVASPAPYVVRDYLDRMDLAYAAADLALCRSGASTCSELAAVGLPAVYVPFPHGNGEQRLNAQPVVEAGGGLLVDDATCTAEWVAANLAPLAADAARLATMSAAAARFGRRDADDRLAAMVLAAAAPAHRAGGRS
ncbi:UDP-N-acetylglucosamine--N-acetylmuramyl-(pentapeptide) pyrophosphoryl-undecaprenol N-acetylglucosamine transferase [Motilibacter peucedani]|uniref:UDP-N-acetylglucosamine--N-acetylmuramyl-(pentapeptide) pyrophosphoryl-undecaprenol N-acetylglucosamine transferase n=1 Tax=Motilibacter peucedani TaxID=598650 RepID=A0A420XPJ3_9ACTN|nr:undecaprenyldiphospho-muramoylpentapeptide beta-N-acetylglucosaminyltransferase [Motilibacter peucedani]RKS74120.1 UDP-N-acetylglucosamine--N-acetylmuramyl-(pentapeptide) pyrophosphoryl-undecaprenol N-acetylglucosamine transferase [Motilibacter peucedani]